MLQPLTTEQIRFFHDQGYLILRQFASHSQVAAMRALAEDHVNRHQGPLELEADVHYPGSPANATAPGGETIRRLLQAYDRDAVLRAWACDARLTHNIRAVLDDADICLVRNHHNCVMTKHPRYSSSTLWHQDIRYWSFQRPDLVNTWLALGEETARNGCMRLIPGSHRVKWAADRFDELRFFRPDNDANRGLMHQALRAELQAGDVLLFHSCLLHAAGRNHTDTRKMAVVFTYRQANNQPLPETRSARLDDISLPMPTEPLQTPDTRINGLGNS